MRIVFINPYFGRLPFWFDAFLVSCSKNMGYEWLIPTDCEIPVDHPDNVTFVQTTLDDLCEAASDVLNISISYERPYKICDLRPSFGLIFESYIEGCDFWGHCDFDVIWGNIGKFITELDLQSHDIITSRKGKMAGHFSLYRNISEVNYLFQRHPIWQKAMLAEENYYFDEVGMTEVVENSGLRVKWDRYLFNTFLSDEPGRIPLSLNRWRWRKGSLHNLVTGEEVMYVNFMQWKDWLLHSDVNYDPSITELFLSFTHISTSPARFPKLSPRHFKPFIKTLLNS